MKQGSSFFSIKFPFFSLSLSSPGPGISHHLTKENTIIKNIKKTRIFYLAMYQTPLEGFIPNVTITNMNSLP
jgi:hypothetical protein